MHNPVYLYCGVAEKCWPCISVTMESKSVYKVMFLRDFSSLHTQYSSTLSNKIQCYNEARKPFSEKSFIYLVYFNEKHSDQRKIFCVVKKKRRRRGGHYLLCHHREKCLHARHYFILLGLIFFSSPEEM